MRHVVFGDTGGHGTQLLASLVELGLDTRSFLLPEDLTVIHMGDLIHRGTHSDELVQIVDQIMQRNPGRWIQLLGNHEAQHLPGGPVFWRCACSEATLGTLHDWWGRRDIRVAFALPRGSAPRLGEFADVADKDILFTHAGLNADFWARYLARAKTAAEVVGRLSELTLRDVAQPGGMLGYPPGRNVVSHPPGPLWALASREVYPSWLGVDMPFVQVHGHTAAWKWEDAWNAYGPSAEEDGSWYPGTPLPYIEATVLDDTHRVSYTPVAGSLLVGVDPGYEMYVKQPAQPYLSL